jgi:hypothetical protein
MSSPTPWPMFAPGLRRWMPAGGSLPMAQIKAVDREIFSAVRQQSGTQARSRQDLGVATGQVAELFGRVRDIQRKAGDTELLVQEICRWAWEPTHAGAMAGEARP